MSQRTENFNPQQYITLAPGTAASTNANITQNLTLNAQNSTPLQDIRIYNAANGVVFVNWGGTGVTATTTTGFPVGPGLVAGPLRMGGNPQGVAAIMGTGAGSVYIQIGNGG